MANSALETQLDSSFHVFRQAIKVLLLGYEVRVFPTLKKLVRRFDENGHNRLVTVHHEFDVFCGGTYLVEDYVTRLLSLQ